ncbi:MAG: hypothetical protein Alis3KO_08610 [Aliiglaciecola sp.]
MKNFKKYLLVACFISLTSGSNVAHATGAKVKPPESEAFVEIVWFQPILNWFNF